MTSPEANSKPLPDKINNLLDNSEVEEGKKEELLQAMLGIARGITEHTNGTAPALNLKKDFHEAFESLSADKVDMILSYRDKPPMIVGHPDTLSAFWNNGQQEAAVTPRILRKPEQDQVPPDSDGKEPTVQ
jgi:hypothetical protein